MQSEGAAEDPGQLAERFGLNVDETLEWARARAATLLADLDPGSELHGLLDGVELDAPSRPRSMEDEPSVVKKLPPIPTSVRAAAEEDDEEIEELDLEEFEEIDADELELVEDDEEEASEDGAYDDVPVRSGDTAPHSVVHAQIDDGHEDEALDAVGDEEEASSDDVDLGAGDDKIVGDDSDSDLDAVNLGAPSDDAPVGDAADDESGLHDESLLGGEVDEEFEGDDSIPIDLDDF